ncbi:MAG: histidinol-phosphatase HisJ [Promethearchaeota archaeon]|nr:MAG: histidinol-phosphatase HisJ [Candidatus Lokiarchaeota archaeon]
MLFQDWHSHNELCRHARGSIEDYIKTAINKGLNLIGISDHFPYECLEGIDAIPYEEYAMKLGELDLYLSRVKNLKEKYQNIIEIKLAFELDYIKPQVSAHKPYLKPYSEDLDYILGSVHILLRNGKLFAFDDNRFLNDYQLYESINQIYIDYYHIMQDMISSSDFSFDIISHFDLPKKYNKQPEDAEIIADHIDKTLELIRKKDLTIEINTSGWRKEVKEQYPSKKIIKKMYELDIPILLGSDAHRPDEVGYRFKEALKLVRDIGYNQLAYFDKRKRSFIEIS